MGKATQISHGKNSHWGNKVYRIWKYKYQGSYRSWKPSWNSEIKIPGLEKSLNLKYCRKSWKDHGISSKTIFFFKAVLFSCIVFESVVEKRAQGRRVCVRLWFADVSWKIEKVPWKSYGFFQLYTCMNPDNYGLHVSRKIEKVPWKSHGFFQLYKPVWTLIIMVCMCHGKLRKYPGKVMDFFNCICDLSPRTES